MSGRKQKALVFGGSGFLGSHVSDCLSGAGFDVAIFDKEPSVHLQPQQQMILGDVLDERKVRQALEGVSIVYNFGGMTSLDECANAPVKAVQNNILGHTVILEQSRQAGVERMVFASSIYVYSRHGSFYKITKQACENLTQEYAVRHGLNFTILRYGSLYGPRAQDWNGVQRYLKQAVCEGRIDYPGTGEERREYIHVLDAARLSVEVLSETYRNKYITITGNYLLSSRELLAMIGEMLNNQVQVCFTNQTQFHHYQMTPYSYSPPMAVKLAPNPSIDMGEGLLRQIEEIHRHSKPISQTVS